MLAKFPARSAIRRRGHSGLRRDRYSYSDRLESNPRDARCDVFVVAGLLEGKYNVFAGKQGFRTSVQTDVTLDAATRRNLDFKMEISSLTECISVSTAIEQVQTASGDMTRVISGQQLRQVALTGRNYSQLLRLIPGRWLRLSIPLDLPSPPPASASTGFAPTRSPSILRSGKHG